MKLRNIVIFATVGLFSLGLLICPAQAFKGTYKVGAVFSVTGRTSFLGDPGKKTAEMIAEQINAAGGIKALGGYRKDWNEKLGAFRNEPRHDWASHGADAFRTGAVGFKEEASMPSDWRKKRNRKWIR